MIERIITSQAKSITYASFILFTCFLLSAFLGLLRDRFLAGTFGAGDELDVYYSAFIIPDFFALIFIFGAISVAVVPIFSFYFLKSEKEAWNYFSFFFNIFLGILIFVCTLMAILAPFVVSLVAPGFPEFKKELTVSLMRIMFLSPIILGISNIISGVLQFFHRFLATALAPIMYNVGIIIGILFLYPLFGLKGLAWGVVLGGIFHLLIQIPAFLACKPQYHFGFNYQHPGIVKTLKLMIPRSIGLGAYQINRWIITAIASTLSGGSIAVFNLANNLSSFLMNAIAFSLSTALFPTLSLAFLQADEKRLVEKFFLAFRQLIFMAIPLSVLFIILRAQIVRVVLGAGKFGWLDTRLTTACLGILVLSICGQALILILAKTFYATSNTFIPALVTIGTVIVNIFLSFGLVFLIQSSPSFYLFLQALLRLENIKDIGVIGLAIAFSFSTLLESFILLFLLSKRIPLWKHLRDFGLSFLKIIFVSGIMGIFVFLTRNFIGAFFTLSTFWEVFCQLIISGLVGVITFVIFCYLMKIEEIKRIFDFLKGIFFFR